MAETLQSEITSCYHCGDPCPTTNIKSEDKIFCCRGCKTVFELLNENDLVEYYELERNPGLKKEEVVFSDFTFLDIPEIRQELLSFEGGGTERVTLNLPGIHCSSCIWLLENLNRINASVVRSEVNFLKKEVSIQYKSDQLSLRQVAELLDSIGYKPLIELDRKKRKQANRRKDLSYIYKLGISGFAFGNIMLLSFPEYFSEGMYADEQFGAFFGYINMIFALPVFFYCSSGYFSSAWKGLKHRFLNIDVPISLGILVLFLRSTFEVVTQTGAGYFDSMTGLVFFLLVGRWFQNRTYQALSFERNYKSYFPLGVTRIRDNKEEHVLLKDVEVGDEILIHHGEIIPADSTLISGEAVIDYSFVTGEADPVRADVGQKLYAGGQQEQGQIRIQVEKAFSQSYLMQLWKQEEKQDENPDLSKTIDRVSHYFTAIILIIASASAVYWWFVDPSQTFHAFSSVLIIACPCALALTIPFTYGNGLRLLERAGIYLRDSRFIEVISKVDTIVFDKTGTITTQKKKNVQYSGKDLSDVDTEYVASLARQSTHPLSRMVFAYLNKAGEEDVADFKENTGQGIQGKIGKREIKLGSASYLDIEEKAEGTSVFLQIDDVYYGRFEISNEYRPALKGLIDDLESQEYKLQVITGDGEGERSNLQRFFSDSTPLKFRMNPFEKRNHIEKVKESGNTVMMIGDGLNDAGAIKRSDVGVSISDDIFGFLPSCDVILESNMFPKIPQLMAFSKTLKRLVIAGFIISFTYNLVGLFFAVQGMLSPVIAAILMPLSSITVVSFAIFSSNLYSRKHKIF